MFGFKKTLENQSFNNILICAIGETIRASGRMPTEAELFLSTDDLLKFKNAKLSQEQFQLLKSCALEFKAFGWPSELLIPEYKKFFVEFPEELTSYNKIVDVLRRHCLLYA